MLKTPAYKAKRIAKAPVAPRRSRYAVVSPIRTQKEFDAVVGELDHLADGDPQEGSAAYDRMELLGILVAAYEEQHVPALKPTSPQELVKFMADQKGMTSSDLAEVFGGRSRLSEFLNDNRELSKAQIVRVRDALGISADLLLG